VRVDRAFADLRAAAPSTARSDLVTPRYRQYLRGDFAEAAASFAKAQPIAPDAGELAGSTDWWMSLSRAGAARKRRRCSIGGRIRSR
jgi:hypothetical protein